MPICSHPIPQPQGTANLLSILIDLSFLDISYRWNHTIHMFCISISLSMKFLSFIHIVVCTSNLFLLLDIQYSVACTHRDSALWTSILWLVQCLHITVKAEKMCVA